MQALLEQAGRLSELTELIGAQVELLEREQAQPEVVAVLHYRLGELLGKHEGRSDLALTHYRLAYEADPSLLRAMYEARLLHLQRGELRAACSLYEQEASTEPDVTRKVALLGEVAQRYHELGDHDGAVSALDRARSLAPGDVALTHALASALVERSAQASVSRAVPLAALTQRSQHVLLGEPLDSYSVWERIGSRKHIVTYTRVRAHELLAGTDPKTDEVLVRTLGGRVGELGDGNRVAAGETGRAEGVARCVGGAHEAIELEVCERVDVEVVGDLADGHVGREELRAAARVHPVVAGPAGRR